MSCNRTSWFDTNRAWCTKLPALVQLFPAARVICCVRNIGWVMDSIERLVRGNPFELSGTFGFEPGATVYSRVNRLASSDCLVGYALDALREGFFGEDAARLILVEYQALTRDPQNTLKHLYTVLGEADFAHDFENVEYQPDDFDIELGAREPHTVRRRVEWVERQSVLPPLCSNGSQATYFGRWRRRTSAASRSFGSAGEQPRRGGPAGQAACCSDANSATNACAAKTSGPVTTSRVQPNASHTRAE
jgi:hypothetical protein